MFSLIKVNVSSEIRCIIQTSQLMCCLLTEAFPLVGMTSLILLLINYRYTYLKMAIFKEIETLTTKCYDLLGSSINYKNISRM